MGQIPVINFSNLAQGTSWENVKSQVREALEEQGFFATKFEQSPLHLRRSAFDKVREAFDLPVETKQRNNFNNPGRGYLGQDPSHPLYESLGIDDAVSPGNVESFANLMWPEGNPSFSEVTQAYCEKMSELDKMIRKMILESFGLDKYIDEHMNSTEYSLRFHKYNGTKSDSKEVGLRYHRDQNFLTILQQSEPRGLEVLTKDGQWITPQFTLDSYIVMIGQSFRAFMNGRLRAPPHGVIMRGGDETRYSITLSSAPKQHCVIKVAEEMVDKEHPLRFKPFKYSDFRRFVLSGEGFNSDDSLKDFAGI